MAGRANSVTGITPVFEPDLSEEHVRELIAGGESETVDFKREYKLNGRFAATQVKDVAAMMVYGGYLLFGVEPGGGVAGVRFKGNAFDESSVRAVLERYIQPPFQVRTKVVAVADREVGVLFCAPSPAGAAWIVAAGYADAKKGGVRAQFRPGDKLLRDGTSTRRAHGSDARVFEAARRMHPANLRRRRLALGSTAAVVLALVVASTIALRDSGPMESLADVERQLGEPDDGEAIQVRRVALRGSRSRDLVAIRDRLAKGGGATLEVYSDLGGSVRRTWSASIELVRNNRVWPAEIALERPVDLAHDGTTELVGTASQGDRPRGRAVSVPILVYWDRKADEPAVSAPRVTDGIAWAVADGEIAPREIGGYEVGLRVQQAGRSGTPATTAVFGYDTVLFGRGRTRSQSLAGSTSIGRRSQVNGLKVGVRLARPGWVHCAPPAIPLRAISDLDGSWYVARAASRAYPCRRLISFSDQGYAIEE